MYDVSLGLGGASTSLLRRSMEALGRIVLSFYLEPKGM